jgi:ankyrin repeat protein
MLPVHRCVELLTAATSHITKEVNFWRLCPERYRADAFVELAINQRLDWLRQFLGHGHPVDAPDRLGSTAIQASCRFNYFDSVSCLLAAGADPNQCQNGQALEDLLYDNDDGTAIRALLAEYRRRDITGESPQA